MTAAPRWLRHRKEELEVEAGEEAGWPPPALLHLQQRRPWEVAHHSWEGYLQEECRS